MNATEREAVNRAAGRNAAIAALLASSLLLAACGVTAYLPVMKRLQLMSLAEYDRPRVEEHLEKATAADRWSADPWVELAQLHWLRWIQSREEPDLQRFEAADAEMLARRPRGSELWLKSGDWYHQAWRLSKDTGHLRKAIEHYGRSVELYPNSSQRRAKLAIVLREARQTAKADSERTEALRLDALTPHADQKLTAELRAELLRNSAKQPGQSPN